MTFDAATFLVGVGLGAVTGGAVVCLVWVPSMKFRSLEAYCEGKEAAFRQVTMERIPDFAQDGVFRKKYYLVIRERLLNNGLPFSPFWEHRFLIGERLDKDELLSITNALTAIADKILGLSEFRTTVLEMLKSRGTKSLGRNK